MLNEVEQDFLIFIAERNDEQLPEVQKRYEASKRALQFDSKEFTAYEETSYQLLQVFFNDQDERSLFASYRHYAYPDMLRMLSYSFPKPRPTIRGYVRTALTALRSGDISKLTSFLRRKIGSEKKQSVIDLLLESHGAPTVVDYGCGFGYLSFDLAQRSPDAKVILVDLDTIKLDFAEFRFKRHGIAYETIRITAGNQYPELPPHDICIATDVMEHLYQPLAAYAHIRDSQKTGGILYGNFEDHNEEMFHVHPHMSDVRDAVQKDYIQTSPEIYTRR